MNKKYFVRLITILLVAVIGISSNLKAANQVWYPIIQSDCGALHDLAMCEPNFTPFIILDSCSEVDGITIKLDGDLDARRRGAPTGIPFEQIYRDFIFGKRPSGITITLSGLVPNQDYEITIYSWDSSNPDTQMADWLANGDRFY